MKICYINPTVVLRRPIAELANILANDGHKVAIITPVPLGEKINTYFSKILSNKNIEIIPIPSFYSKKLRFAIPVPGTLITRTLKAMKDYDLFHIWTYFYPYPVVPLLIKRFFKPKYPMILTTDGVVGYLYKSPSKLINTALILYTKLIGKTIFDSANKMTFYSKLQIPYGRMAGMPVKHIKVISTGIHLNKFKPSKSARVKIRKEFKIKPDETIVLFVGMLTERKGIDHLINITKNLVDKNLKLRVLVVGHGPFEKQYKELTNKYKLDGVVTFTGNRSDVPTLMAGSDIFFLASRGEGLPGVVMEAAASGIPSIATEDGLTADLIIHNKTGFLAKPHQENEFEKYLEKLVSNKTLRQKMGKSSRKHIEKFDWKVVAKRYVTEYKQLINQT
jgi:glycosyltransferase involved in cell wall biosynthesis